MAVEQGNHGMSEVFDWVFSVVATGLLGAIAWIFSHLISLDRKVAVLDARPFVDPIKFAEVNAQLTAAVMRLTEAVTDLKIELKEIRRDFDIVVKQLEGEVNAVSIHRPT